MRSAPIFFAASVGVLAMILGGCAPDDPAAVLPTGEESIAQTTPPGVGERILDNQELTVRDQRVTYPDRKPARISSETFVLEPGEQTGWRRHRVPVYVHVLAGTYTIDYGDGALVEYPEGSAFVQATKVDYNGTNVSEEPVSILRVYIGAKGVPDVIER